MCHFRAPPLQPTRICVLARHFLRLVLILHCSSHFMRAAQADERATATVTIRNQVILVELAQTEAQKALGLGGRDALLPDRGMLFPYAKTDYYTFWMKGMRFDLDIIWICKNRIVDIAANVSAPRGGPLVKYRPRVPADQVLEVVAGYAANHGWNLGDTVLMESPASSRK